MDIQLGRATHPLVRDIREVIMVSLDTQFANQIIEKVKKYTDYNINIMNERGIIVASRTRARIGTFHEIALRIIQGDQDEIIVEENETYAGTKEGVNTAFYYKNNKIGVIGITGKPAEVRPIAMMLRMSMETILEYEVYKEERFQRRNLKDQLLSRVMYGENVTKDELVEYAERLDLVEHFVRIPIVLRFNQTAEFAERIIADIREYHFLSSQDISTVTRSNDVIIFKHFEKDLMHLIRDYKFQVAESISAVLRYLKSREITYTIYVGSFQNKYVDYRTGFQHCRWLRSNCKLEQRSYYFYDYLEEYFHSFVPFEELRGIYKIFKEQLEDKEIDNYITTISALSAANYNLTESSRLIHVHKNTMIYRLDKLRNMFGLNPILEQSDREFMVNLCEYLVKTKTD